MPSALAIFTCRPNSHPFQERHVYLDEPIKIGRSVARCRPAQNNATFDCKVLSRNHALVWFDHKTSKVMSLQCFTIMYAGSQGFFPEDTFLRGHAISFFVCLNSSGNLIEAVEWKTEKVLLLNVSVGRWLLDNLVILSEIPNPNSFRKSR